MAGATVTSGDEGGNRKGGWHTRRIPSTRIAPEKSFTELSLSLRIAAERKMVTTGQEKMMHKASGTGIKLTLAKAVMKERAPVRPEMKKVRRCF